MPELDATTQTPKTPKVELHVHLDGAIRHSTVWELGKKKGLNLPGKDEKEFEKHINSLQMGDLPAFLKTFEHFLPAVIGDLDAIERIAYEFCHDKVADGIVYFEARFCPHLMANKVERLFFGQKPGDVTPEMVVQRVCDGIARGYREYGIKGRLILCTMRGVPEWCMEILQLCQKFKGPVVAMDIAGNETLPLDPEHIEAFQEAERLGIPRVAHAGEAGPAENVKIAMEVLKAQRIGHGYHIVEDESIYKMVKDTNIHLELCPISSLYTGACSTDWSKHPAIRFAQDGLNIGLNTDDPTVFCNILDDDFKVAKEKLHFTDEQIIQSVFNSARACFLPPDEKEELIKQLEEAYNKKN
ncbi:adenosine deaminase-like [Amphiura filiformis]|uniref:adenosine deaminase-like n=1 Tax=Amphiura filiformis TaxID=82378 RepID=UPI003B21F806